MTPGPRHVGAVPTNNLVNEVGAIHLHIGSLEGLSRVSRRRDLLFTIALSSPRRRPQFPLQIALSGMQRLSRIIQITFVAPPHLQVHQIEPERRLLGEITLRDSAPYSYLEFVRNRPARKTAVRC